MGTIKIVYFDGYCSLCNGTVDWLMRADRRQTLNFASLQGQTAARELAPEHIRDLDTLVYQRDGKIYTRSGAVLRIVGDLGGPWTISRIFLVIPAPLRDLLYRSVAKNRYRWFGRRESCRLPTPAEKQRLLP